MISSKNKLIKRLPIMQNIEERFFIPLGLSEADRINGQPVYSSEVTKNKYLETVKSQPYLSKVYPKIEKFVKSGVILPAYGSSGLLASLADKAFSNKIDGDAQGYFLPERNKIYILVDAGSKIFWKSGYSLGTVTFHELMHYAAKNRSAQFFSKFSPVMEDFYKNFYKRCVGIDVPSKNIKSMITFIFKTFESNPPTQSDLDNLEDFYLRNVFSDDQVGQEATAKILIPVNMFIRQPGKFFASLNSNKLVNKLAYSLLESYNEVFGIRKPETTPIQELIFPSEVAAVSTSRPSAEHYAVL